MQTGTIKWFSEERGFGFIHSDSGSRDIFVPLSSLQAAGISRLNEGQKVTYEYLTHSDDRLTAVKLALV